MRTQGRQSALGPNPISVADAGGPEGKRAGLVRFQGELQRINPTPVLSGCCTGQPGCYNLVWARSSAGTAQPFSRTLLSRIASCQSWRAVLGPRTVAQTVSLRCFGP